MNKSINLNLLLDIAIMGLILAIGFLIPSLFSSNSQEGFKNPFKKPFKKLEKQFKKLQKQAKKAGKNVVKCQKRLNKHKNKLATAKQELARIQRQRDSWRGTANKRRRIIRRKNIKLDNQEKYMKGQAREIAHLDEAGDKLRQRIVKRRSDTFNNDDLKV